MANKTAELQVAWELVEAADKRFAIEAARLLTPGTRVFWSHGGHRQSGSVVREPVLVAGHAGDLKVTVKNQHFNIVHVRVCRLEEIL